MEKDKNIVCEDGVCNLPGQETQENTMRQKAVEDGTLVYFGDPMCSWCWGITNSLRQLKEEYKGRLGFRLVMGGLRPGGGDLWNDEMKAFLREHWEHVAQASGQPFNYGLLDWEEFNYDTEPAARAVRVVRDIDSSKELDFYAAVQHAFYVENHDPNQLSFYKPVCEKLEIPFATFQSLFESEGYKQLVRQDFAYAQQVGVRGFPTVALQQGDQLIAIARGYATFEQMRSKVEELMHLA